MNEESQAVNSSNKKRRISAFRNRRRADRLPAHELRAIQADFKMRKNSEDTGRAHLLPRPEVIDGVLIGHSAQIEQLVEDVRTIRREMGVATSSLYLVQRKSA